MAGIVESSTREVCLFEGTCRRRRKRVSFEISVVAADGSHLERISVSNTTTVAKVSCKSCAPLDARS